MLITFKLCGIWSLFQNWSPVEEVCILGQILACQDMDREGMGGNLVPFLKLSRCEDILSNCEYILYGKLDADGRLKGLSELVNHGTEGDSLEIRPEEVGEEDSSDTFCYSVSVPLSIRAVRAHFTRGLPQHRVSIKHHTVWGPVPGSLAIWGAV